MPAHVPIEVSGDAVIDPTAAGLRLPDAALARVVPDLTCTAPVPCPACAGTRFVRVARADRYGFPLDYVACRGCGLLFANPYYDAESLDRFYLRHYAPVYGRTARPELAFAGELERGHAVRRLVDDHVAARGLAYSSVLDVGCSHGGFLAAFPDSWVRVGYDYDESLFGVGRTRGLELNFIGGLDTDARKFDVIMANQVVEHTRDPAAFLRRLARLLAPRGVIYVEVPGLRSQLVAHIDYRLMFKNAHCFLFDAHTFERCAAQAGLRSEYLDETVRALLAPGDYAARAAAPGAAPGEATAEFVRDKVSRYRPPGPIARLAALPARILRALARRTGTQV